VDYERLILIFTSIIYEALPFIVLGVVIAGLLEEFIPQQFIARVIPRSRPLAIAIGGLLGIVFPMCECGIIPVMRRLLRKGLPLSVCTAYVLSGPVINVVVLTSTYVAFNPRDPQYFIYGGPLQVVLLRAGLAFLVSFVTSLLVEMQWNRHGKELLAPSVVKGLSFSEEDAAAPAEKRSLAQRLTAITETALHDFVDIMAFLVLGAFIAAISRELLDESQAQALFQESPAVAILLMMGFAIAFCLCSEADAFVAANFQNVWPPASKIAFLVLGPMLDFKLYLMYRLVFRPRLIWTIILAVVVQVFVYTLILHYAWPQEVLPSSRAITGR
jgi:uncharacterized membrane protein YraQ (UPF0718 family)